jgi:hypothetical protein
VFPRNISIHLQVHAALQHIRTRFSPLFYLNLLMQEKIYTTSLSQSETLSVSRPMTIFSYVYLLLIFLETHS